MRPECDAQEQEARLDSCGVSDVLFRLVVISGASEWGGSRRSSSGNSIHSIDGSNSRSDNSSSSRNNNRFSVSSSIRINS